jgi:hypothetical protein
VGATDTGVVEPLPVGEVVVTGDDDEEDEAPPAEVDVEPALLLSVLPHAAVKATRTTSTRSDRAACTSGHRTRKEAPAGPPSLAGFEPPAVVRRISRS